LGRATVAHFFMKFAFLCLVFLAFSSVLTAQSLRNFLYSSKTNYAFLYPEPENYAYDLQAFVHVGQRGQKVVMRFYALQDWATSDSVRITCAALYEPQAQVRQYFFPSKTLFQIDWELPQDTEPILEIELQQGEYLQKYRLTTAELLRRYEQQPQDSTDYSNSHSVLYPLYARLGDTLFCQMPCDTMGLCRVLYQKNADIGIAPPPMNESRSDSFRTTEQAYFRCEWVLPQKGFYTWQRQDLTAPVQYLIVVDADFPVPKQPNSLLEPLIYISSDDEYRRASDHAQPKAALDRFWLQLTEGDQEAARKKIRTFYRRVEMANRLFTSHTEGWKTDRGMIYIVMGAPTWVEKHPEHEIWTYSQQLIFRFDRLQWAENTYIYQLQRKRRFQTAWYRAVRFLRHSIE
jgi:GWxTD domain-containing protein